MRHWGTCLFGYRDPNEMSAVISQCGFARGFVHNLMGPLFGQMLIKVISHPHSLVKCVLGVRTPPQGCEGAGCCAAPRAVGGDILPESSPALKGQGGKMGSILCCPKGKHGKFEHQKPPPACHDHDMRVPCPTRGRGAAREHRTPRTQKKRKGPMAHTNDIRES